MTRTNKLISAVLLSVVISACSSDSAPTAVNGSADQIADTNAGSVPAVQTADATAVNDGIAEPVSDANSQIDVMTNTEPDDSAAASTASDVADATTSETVVSDALVNNTTELATLADAQNINGAFGLTSRSALANLNLPIDGEQLGNYELVNAYPNLRFLEALLVDDVPGENRLVVVEQQGRIQVFDDSPDTTDVTEILDYSDRVAFTGEQGLLGMAFDPQFEQNRYVYIYYTQKDSNRSIITRLTWDAATDRLDPSTDKVVLQVDQPFQSHNGGMIAFGPDNYLYIALGDGGDGGDPLNNGQDRSTLLANVLRIDVNPADSSQGYAIPPSNPFVGEPNVREEIYAYGFRNPWRFSFDRQTGDLWLGDVGQEGHEEINLVTAGGNYGWRVYEGNDVNKPELNTLPESAFTFPVHTYPNELGKAVIGGYVYRGAVASLQGRYIYSDFYNGIVTALTLNGTSVVGIENVGTIEGPTSFGENRDGELLVVSRYGGLFKFAESSASSTYPTLLSQTGVFSDVASLTPAEGIVEYTPSHPFWSDGTLKRRWIGVPDGAQIEFTDNDWTFPVGSVSVKHFEIELTEGASGSTRRLETRLMYHTTRGWQGITYRWNAAQTEATLLNEGQTEQLMVSLNDGTTRVQRYDYPSRADCLACHTQASAFLLGLETGQLNTTFDYPAATDNQLRSLNNIQMFNQDIGDHKGYDVLPPLTDETASIESRARAYLDVNCSVCHQPGGTAPTSIDLRHEVSNDGLNAIGVAPQSGSFNIENAQLIAPGSKETSIILHRMQLLDGARMPPVSSHVVDEAAVRIIGDWIDGM